jgi:signal transduction histidine kinase
MSVVENPVRRPSFLRALLRRGAAVIAAAPADLPDAVADPNPVPGWRRISMMSYDSQSAATDTLITRACRYVVLAPLIYRVVVLPTQMASFVSNPSFTGTATLLSFTMMMVALNVVAIVWVLRMVDLRQQVVRLMLLFDALVALILNLGASFAVSGDAQPAVAKLSWTYLVGVVALWTLAWGVPAASALILASFPLRAAMTWIGEVAGNPSPEFSQMLYYALGLVVALVTSMGILVLVGLGTWLALGLGIRRGQECERARTRRFLHDTVLQTLEAMAMPTAGDEENASQRLAELRGVARAQAMELRKDLDTPADISPHSTLSEDLTNLATEMARAGLRARLVVADLDDWTLSEARQLAVRDAVREALRNTMKHSDTTEVVLRVEEREGGIAVIARDHGVGFDQDQRPAGFGISESIVARLAEVGGQAKVESTPGRGTRVTLWVPR